MAIKPQTDYWHWIGGNKATNWLLTPIGGTISHKLTTDTDWWHNKPRSYYWHRRLGGWPESREYYTLGQGHTQSLWTKPCTKLPLSCGRWVLMFSVGINLYLIPTINGDVWAQARFFIRNDKLEAGKAVCSTSIILVLRPEFPRGEFKFPPASSWYFIKRSKLTSLCPGSGHYTD